MSASTGDNPRQRTDRLLVRIADYVHCYRITRIAPYRIARYCLMDALGCAMRALDHPECMRLLGPLAPGTVVPHGARVPGTRFQLDPVRAAFNLGAMIRWTDFNDGFAQAGHPSDNLGGILPVADYLSRTRLAAGKRPILGRDVLTAMIKAYEIQGSLGVDNPFSRLGFDRVKMIAITSAAVVSGMLGGGKPEIISAVSNAITDGAALRIYRSGAAAGRRRNWAGGDATARAVELAMMAMKGERGHPRVLTTPRLGFNDALCQGTPLEFARPLGCGMIETVIFKLVAASMLAQTAVECAIRLHPRVKNRIGDIKAVTITSQKPCIEDMDRRGALKTPGDREHCLQYLVAVGLIHGRVTSAELEDRFAAGDRRIDRLRVKMRVVEEPRYTTGLRNFTKRSVANALEVQFRDGSRTPMVEIEYPAGHPHRRADGLAMVEEKFRDSIATRFSGRRRRRIVKLFGDQRALEAIAVNELIDCFVPG